MKQLFFAIAAMAIITSCDNTKVASSNNEGDQTNTSNRNAENMQAVWTAIETGDVSKIDTLMADDVVDHNGGPQGQDVRGKDSVLALLSQMHTYFDGLKIEVQHQATTSDGQYHYATVRMTGTAKQNPWGMPVGMKVDDTSIDLVKLRDGKATDHWSFLSWGDINEMMKGMSGGGQPPAKEQ